MSFELKELALPKGCIIICPHCHEEVLMVQRNVYRGQNLTKGIFRPLKKDLPVGNSIACPCCGKSLMALKKFLVKDLGFLPNYKN